MPAPTAGLSAWSWLRTGLVLLLTLHPIVAPDFWWQVARGRAVWEGHLAPSQTLLAFEPNSDADWLGGLPWYLLFSAVGPSLLSCGVAAAAVLLAASLANLVESRSQFAGLRIALIVLGFAAATDAWSPTPALIDACGVVFVWNLAGRLRSHFKLRTLVGLLLCQMIWANCAAMSLLGLLVTFLRLNVSDCQDLPSLCARRQLSLLALMSLCSSATPRGLDTLWDSLRVLCPWVSADVGTLTAAGFLPTFTWPPTVEVTAFVILCVVNTTFLARSALARNAPVWRDLAAFALIIMIAASSAANIGVAALLLMLDSLERIPADRRRDASVEASPAARPKSARDWATPVVLTAAALTVGLGVWPGSQTRLGWGLAPQLEPTLLEYALDGVRLDGTAWCGGTREAGLLAWLRPGSIRPADVPARALLSGRLRDHVRIGWDLAHDWTDQHRRSDGTWGGWLIPLRQRQTRLLLIPSGELAIIRGLGSSRWKPLAIDTPAIPFGLVTDPALGRQIGQTQALLNLVEVGEWTYTSPPAAGAGHHFDLCGWLSRKHNRRIDLRLARTLAAMNRDIAALKVLTESLRRGDSSARREFRDIQLSLAYREFQASGQATAWRMYAYLESGGDPEVLRRFNPAGESAFATLEAGYRTAAAAYGRGDMATARRYLAVRRPEILFARSQICLQEGNPREAARWFSDLFRECPNTTESEAALDAYPEFSESPF